MRGRKLRSALLTGTGICSKSNPKPNTLTSGLTQQPVWSWVLQFKTSPRLWVKDPEKVPKRHLFAFQEKNHLSSASCTWSATLSSLGNRSDTFSMCVPGTYPLHAAFSNSKADRSSLPILSIFFTVELHFPLTARDVYTNMHLIKMLIF